MEDEERIIRALRELQKIGLKDKAEMEEEQKHRKEVEERRKRLYKFFYEKASPITFIIPKDSSL